MAQIIPFKLDSSFDPETVESLSVAFEEACRWLEKSSQPLRASAAREIVAKHIIELAKRGERDAVRLCNSAIEFLASTSTSSAIERDYRLYVMAESNHVAGPPKIISCKSDQDAIEHAKRLLGPCDIEIWDGARAVIRLDRIKR